MMTKPQGDDDRVFLRLLLPESESTELRLTPTRLLYRSGGLDVARALR